MVFLNILKHINNITSLQVFQLIRFGTLLLISIMFAKSGLSVAEIGSYETFMLIAGSVSFFWTTGIIQSFLSLFRNNRTFSGKKNDSKSPEIFNLFITISFFSIASCAVIIIFRNFFSDHLNNGDAIPYFNLLILYVFLSNPAVLTEYIYLALGRYTEIVIYGVITYLLQLILVCLPVFSGFNIEYSIYGLLFITFIRICWLVPLVLKNSVARISVIYLKEHMKFGLPLIMTALLSSSQQYIAGFIVTAKYDAATLAVFRYGARELPLVMLISNAFSNSLLPDFGKSKVREIMKLIKEKSLKMIYLLFPLAIISLLISKIAFPVIFNPNFSASADIFNIFILLVICRLVFPQTITMGLKKTKIIFWASLAELIICTSLSLLLVDTMGLSGIGLAFVIAFFSEKIILIMYLRFQQKIKMSEYIPLKQLIIGSLLILISYTLTVIWS